MKTRALTPALLIAAAKAMVLGGRFGRAREGSFAELALDRVGGTLGDPWSAAFVYHVGYWSHHDGEEDGGSIWPLPRTGDCEALAEFGRHHAILRGVPEPGDVFVSRREGVAWDRAGIVLDAGGQREEDGVVSLELTTIEGDTTAHGGKRGRGVHHVTRRVLLDWSYAFLHWVDLDGRRALGNPHVPSRIERGRPVLLTVG